MAIDARVEQVVVEYAIPASIPVYTEQVVVEYAVQPNIELRVEQFVIEYIKGRAVADSCPVANDFGVPAVTPPDGCAVDDGFGVD